MTTKNKDLLVSILFIAFGVFVFVESLGIKHMMKNDVGSAFFPKVVAVGIIAVALIKLVFTLSGKSDGAIKKSGSDMKGGWMTILLLAAYVLLFSSVGFILTTAAYLFLQMLILCPEEKRKLPLLGTISVVTPLFVYILFVHVISMPLPKGLFGF